MKQLYILIFFILIGCKGKIPELKTLKKYTKDVYICGKVQDKAVFWKNGIVTNLNNSESKSVANSIQVVGNDVYVAGSEGNFAKYWKNGIGYNLTSGLYEATATSILVKGFDIYIVGYERTTGLYNKARYWKNGIAVSLPFNEFSEYLNKIVVDDLNNVFIGGFEWRTGSHPHSMSQYILKYWKNGITTVLTTLAYGYNPAGAYDIDIDGTDVYVTGSENNFATYWKNGVANKLEIVNAKQNSNANELSIQNSNIFVCGSIGVGTPGERAVYWKNNELFLLESVPYYSVTAANSLVAVSNDVFVVGHGKRSGREYWLSNLACYWKNGKIEILSSNDNSSALDIYVTTQ